MASTGPLGPGPLSSSSCHAQIAPPPSPGYQPPRWSTPLRAAPPPFNSQNTEPAPPPHRFPSLHLSSPQLKPMLRGLNGSHQWPPIDSPTQGRPRPIKGAAASPYSPQSIPAPSSSHTCFQLDTDEPKHLAVV
jgi:hypothetical protein